MKLILGLGNPGPRYEHTRHNLGYLCLDEWSRAGKRAFHSDKLFDYISLKNAVLIKPTTWMNRSGEAARAALRRWDISESMVVYDDLELPLANLRVRGGGGDGGHNGMKSLFEVLPAADLKRLRLGIGKDPSQNVVDYVLDELAAEELLALKPVISKAVELIDIYINRDFTAVLNEYSKWMKSYSASSAPAGAESPDGNGSDTLTCPGKPQSLQSGSLRNGIISP
ncbi:MAG TPA: aminoacyl-tRNA hydrolase [Candidatus Cloacimonadota bacterium]|nr:aminoacyl-tRNA hydrolase [Candidatus Cloacimonadota bacterium]